MTMNRLRRMWIPVLLQTAVAFAGCGDDDDDDDGAKPGDGGLDASTDAGRDASTGDAGRDGGTPLMCKTPATTACAPAASPLGGAAVPGCCYSGPMADGTTADSVCSGFYMGTCLPPAVETPACDDIMVVTMLLQGCCSPATRRCGVNNNAVGLGCVDNDQLETAVKAALPTFMVPAASKKACVWGGGDAGTGDGGALPLILSRDIDAGLR